MEALVRSVRPSVAQRLDRLADFRVPLGRGGRAARAVAGAAAAGTGLWSAKAPEEPKGNSNAKMRIAMAGKARNQYFIVASS